MNNLRKGLKLNGSGSQLICMIFNLQAVHKCKAALKDATSRRAGDVEQSVGSTSDMLWCRLFGKGKKVGMINLSFCGAKAYTLDHATTPRKQSPNARHGSSSHQDLAL